MSTAFRFRLEKVLDHRTQHEELVRQEFARAIAAVAEQQTRAVDAAARADRELDGLREMIAGPVSLADLRAKHADLTHARGRAAHERAVIAQLETVADDRRAELVTASQDREALVQLRRAAHDRHRAEMARVEANTLDELALRRVRRVATG